MKFSLVWSDILSQNLSLKLAVTVLSFVSLCFAVAVTLIAMKDPLVIDRGCESVAATATSGDRTGPEIEKFLKLAISQRFDTDAKDSKLLAVDEKRFRDDEQRKLKAQEIWQAVIVRKVSIDKGSALVETDRLLSVKDIRSAFSFPLELTFATVQRSAENPYGLTLTGVNSKTLEKK